MTEKLSRRRAGLAVACGVALVAGACGAAPAAGPSAGPGSASVVRVVDGDTIVAEIDGHEDRVRLIGIDTPESAIPDEPPECYGAEATRRLGELIPPGVEIRLERDVEARDRFDRLLAYVYRTDDDTFVNLAMAAEGYALSLSIPPNVTHSGAFTAAVAAARAGGLGLWAACPTPS